MILYFYNNKNFRFTKWKNCGIILTNVIFGGVFVLVDCRFDSVSPKFMRIASGNIHNEINVIEVGYNRVPASKQHILTRDVYILHYIVDGKGVFQGEPFDKNCGYLVVPGEVENIVADDKEPYESYWVIFKGTLAPDILKICGLEHRCHVFRFDHNEKCAQIIRKAVFDIQPENNYSEAFSLHAAFNEVVAVHANTVKHASASSNFTAKDLAMIFEKGYQQDLKIEKLAESFHYSRNHLYTLFKEEYGISPQEYLLNTRIDKAKELLADSSINLSIKEISYAVGFKDQFYFSKLFRKKTKLSPMQYKISVKNERKSKKT